MRAMCSGCLSTIVLARRRPGRGPRAARNNSRAAASLPRRSVAPRSPLARKRRLDVGGAPAAPRARGSPATFISSVSSRVVPERGKPTMKIGAGGSGATSNRVQPATDSGVSGRGGRGDLLAISGPRRRPAVRRARPGSSPRRRRRPRPAWPSRSLNSASSWARRTGLIVGGGRLGERQRLLDPALPAQRPGLEEAELRIVRPVRLRLADQAPRARRPG